jgi:hypothetical protein
MLKKIQVRIVLSLAGGALPMFSQSAPATMSSTTPAALAVKRIVSLEYPPLARMARLEGTAILTTTILRDGTIGEIRAESGPEPLTTPATENLSKWRFTGCSAPHGKCVTRVTYSFVLRGECTDSPRCPTEFQVDLPDHVLVTSKVFGRPLP